MMGYEHMMWGYGGFFMLFFWGILITGLVLLVRWLIQQSRSASPNQGETPIAILKKRYARGEIDNDEFEEKKKILLS